MTCNPHITVAAIIKHENQYLLVEEYSDSKKVYNQPAGHWDPEETLIDAVIRETMEETAFNFQPTHIVSINTWFKPLKSDMNFTSNLGENLLQETYLRISFAGELGPKNSKQKHHHGIIQTLWLTRDEIISCSAKLRSPLVLETINDFERGARIELGTIRHIT